MPNPTTQYIVKIVLGFVALALYVLSTPLNGGNPIFTFSSQFQDILIVAIVGAFAWGAVQGNTAVRWMVTSLGKSKP